jgi:hypothetical protein
MVALSLRDAAAAEARDQELALVAKQETLKVGKHAPPQIGVRVLMSYQPGLQRSLELGTICYVSNGYECARVVWDDRCDERGRDRERVGERGGGERGREGGRESAGGGGGS